MNCEVRFTIAYEEIMIMQVSSHASLGATFNLQPGHHVFKFKFDFPVRDARFDITATITSFNKEVDSWASSTKLTVLDDFKSHVTAGVINPQTTFSLQSNVVENATGVLQ